MAVLQSALGLMQGAYWLPEPVASLHQAVQGAHAEAEILVPLHDCCLRPCCSVVVQL